MYYVWGSSESTMLAFWNSQKGYCVLQGSHSHGKSGKICGHGKSLKIKKMSKSRKNENFTLIRIKNIVTDMIVSKIVLWRNYKNPKCGSGDAISLFFP